MKCAKCNGKGFYLIGEDEKSVTATIEVTCQSCGGVGEFNAPNHQDTSSPFNDQNTKLIPDTTGLWFYHLTGLPAMVIEKDGQLYFQAGGDGSQEMKVADFAALKENSEVRHFKFTKLKNQLPTNQPN